MTNLLHPGASTRSGFPIGLCSLCKREDIQMLHTAANFGKRTASKIRRINTLARYRKKSPHRFVGISLPPIPKTYASPVCLYPRKMKGDIKKRVEPDQRIPLEYKENLASAKPSGAGGRSNANAIQAHSTLDTSCVVALVALMRWP